MIFQKPALTLHKIKQLMRSNFEGLIDFSLEILRLALRNKIEASYSIINLINVKLINPQNVI